jgi:phenylalanyl-tRNA synthetase beta chain
MQFPESWLREWINPPIESAALADGLTAAGIEVEAMRPAGAPFSGVVVAEIIEAVAHPNAEKLRVCQVAIGAAAPLQIVCGAPNARVGLKAPLAMVGAKLPGNLDIRAAALRGVDSAGMLCSAKELGIDADASGLLELDSTAPVGLDVRAWLALDEIIFETKLTPNRADCLSLRGLAFEVAAEHGLAVDEPPAAAVSVTSAARRDVEIDDAADCPRYVGRIIEGLDLTRPTPSFMRLRLERAGLRAISLAVDVGNYVMLELGQPLHAFDDERLIGAIRVRRAVGGESLELIDGSTATLTPGTLVIADDAGVQAVAGVMGAASSKTLTSTTRVFLESAHFVPAALMGRARQLGVSSDAAYRFERGVDPALPQRALDRATALLIELAGGRAGPLVEAAGGRVSTPERMPVQLRHSRLTCLLGMTVPAERVGQILSSLGMQVSAQTDGWLVVPPTRRFDIAIEEDLIEEVARIVGYDALPSAPLRGELAAPIVADSALRTSALKRQFAARGFLEAVSLSFVSETQLSDCGLSADSAIRLANPLSADLARMRPSLIPGLLSALKFNLNRQAERVRLVEFGGVFSSDGQLETPMVAGVMAGSAEPEQWARPSRPVDFFDLKGLLAALRPLTTEAIEPTDTTWLHPGQSAQWRLDGRVVARFGVLHPKVHSAWDLRGAIAVFECDQMWLLDRQVPRAKKVSRFPSIRRDLAFSVPREVPSAALEQAARNAAGSVLRELKLFDVFVDDSRDSTSKSVAMGLILQDDSATLQDDFIHRTLASVIDAVQSSTGAQLRS